MTKTKFIIVPDEDSNDVDIVSNPHDSVYLDQIGNVKITKETSDEELEKISKRLVNFNIKKPRDAEKFLPVPHVRHGFENSCSECSAESVIRYWQTKGYSQLNGWNQFSIHRKGYQSFEGNISEGDLGLFKLFKYLNLKVIQKNNASLNDIKSWIDKDIPVIVRITTDPSHRNHHTQVAIGYSTTQIFLNDNDVYDQKNPQYIFQCHKHFLEGFTGRIIVVHPKDI